MDLVLEEPRKYEHVLPIDGIDLMISRSAIPYVQEATIDYVRKENREGFTITSDIDWSTSCEDDW